MLLFAQTLHAGPQAAASVRNMIDTADAIAVCTIAQGTVVQGVAVATLVVEKSLRAKLALGTTLTVRWQGPPTYRSQPRPIEKVRGLFFFRKSPVAREMAVLSAMQEGVDFERTFYILPAGEAPAHFMPPANASIEDRVFLLLAWAKEVGWPPQLGAVFGLAEMYRKMPSDITRATFQRMAQSKNPRVAVLGMRAMVDGSDKNFVETLERDQDRILAMPGSSGILDSLKFYYADTDPASINAMGRMATAPTGKPEVRQAAAGALARLHTQASLPFLASLLDSPDAVLRTFAVGGLAMFANNIPIGSHHPAPGKWSYRTEETMARSAMDVKRVADNDAYYVGFWKQWWQAHRVELTSR